MATEESDMIDLEQLASRIILFMSRNSKSIFAGIACGLMIGTILYYLLPAKFESKMIVTSDILTESYAKEITESLNNLIKETNIKALSERLTLSEKEAAAISNLEIEKSKTDNENKAAGDVFIITANIKEKSTLAKLQSGVIQYLRNNEFVKMRVEQKKKYFISMIDKIDSEIKSLDSLKKKLFLGQPIYSKTSEMMLVDPTSIYSKIVELTRQQWEYKNNLELVDSIQLVEGFTVFEKPASPKLSVLLAIGFFGGFFVAIFILTMKHLFKLANSQQS